jgi:hypothetical protein
VRLVFAGSTALSRAHRLICRMSEDIDLRIVVDSNRSGRGTLQRLRAKVTEALLGAGFKFDPEDLTRRKTETGYTIYLLPYVPVAVGGGGFTPDDPDRNGGVAAAAGRCRVAGDLVCRRSPAATARGRENRMHVDPRDGRG